MKEVLPTVLATLQIEQRFRRPPRSGNGGYVCGRAYLHPGGRVAVLRQFAVHIDVPVPVDWDLVVSWPIADEGRKHQTGSARFSADGKPLAWAAATWLDVDPKDFAP